MYITADSNQVIVLYLDGPIDETAIKQVKMEQAIGKKTAVTDYDFTSLEKKGNHINSYTYETFPTQDKVSELGT
jgi:hypothetical protein